MAFAVRCLLPQRHFSKCGHVDEGQSATKRLVTAAQPPAVPPAAAVAGLVFSLLLITSLVIMCLAVPDLTAEKGPLEYGFGRAISLALHLIPIAGIALLWLLGVLRNRIGALEDRFSGTLMLGSGLLFVACLFASAAVSGAIVSSISSLSAVRTSGEVYFFAREVAYAFMNIFAVKMAGVFMGAGCAIALRTAILPRWIAFIGYAGSLALLLVI
ncbi:hypothetical protein [Paraburkholderia silvatlantica]|nr:hypothetical protein [Paraburkholderia silvatlantica]